MKALMRRLNLKKIYKQTKLFLQKDLDKSIQDIMLDKELAKLSIDITF